MVLDNNVGFYRAVRKNEGPPRLHQDVGFFRVEDVEKAGAQSKGMEAGRQEMENVLNGEIMVGVPIDPALEGSPLEREYLVGFWTGVSERIGDLLKAGGMSEAQVRGWESVMQTIEGRVRDVRGDSAKIDMGDVQDEINRLMSEAQDADTMKLAA